MTEYLFPSDLRTYQQGHFMKIQIYPSDGSLRAPGAQNESAYADTVCLFIPGGGQNGPLTWQMAHEYDDVKLTKLGLGTIGAVTRLFPGGDLIAGAAEKLGSRAMGAARVMGMGTINPKVDVLYGNSELRRFQFSFFMAPQSSKENEDLHTIVRLLRKFSAPQLSAPPGLGGALNFAGVLNGASGQGNQLYSGLWFIPPAEFNISFHSIQSNYAAENKYLPKIGRCVLERIDVDFTQQGEFSTFKDGAPTNLQLTMVFREMRIISQADIDSGY